MTNNTLRTTDGVEIVEGLVVWTNEMRIGRVTFKRHRVTDDGWFDVEYPEGRTVMQNGERVATTFERVKAVDRLRETQQQLHDAGLVTGFVCKQCGAESPIGIGYAGIVPDRFTPDPECAGPHQQKE